MNAGAQGSEAGRQMLVWRGGTSALPLPLGMAHGWPLCPVLPPNRFFALTASSYTLYGERLGLLEENPQPESLHFINALETMLRTTLPLLFLPPGVMRWVNNKLWQDHMDAWDTIFKHGQARRSPSEGRGRQWGNISLFPEQQEGGTRGEGAEQKPLLGTERSLSLARLLEDPGLGAWLEIWGMPEKEP